MTEVNTNVIENNEYAFFLEKEKHKDVFLNAGIYFIYNNVNGKYYIGSSKNLKRRFATHKSNLRNNSHCNNHLQNAWNLYGEENFTFQVERRCHDVNVLINQEKKMIRIFKPEYNKSIVINNSFCLSKETKQKISEKSKEKFIKNPLLIEKIREVGKKSAIFNIGRKHTEKTKLNMSLAAKKRGCSHLHTKESNEKAAAKRRKKVIAFKNGIEYMVFDSISNAALAVKGNNGNIITGIKNNKIRYGYYWKYLN